MSTETNNDDFLQGQYFVSNVELMEKVIQLPDFQGYTVEPVGKPIRTQAGQIIEVKIHHPALDENGLSPFWAAVRTLQHTT